MEETEVRFEASEELINKANEICEKSEVESEQKEPDEVKNDSIECETTEDKSENKLGKFKDSESLLKAYNSLQSEFTKKCQLLSELKKQDCDNSENSSPENEQKLPQYSKSDWNDKLSKFLSENQEAKNFSTKISNILLNNPSLASSENALEVAWAKVLIEENKNQQKLSDEEYIRNYLNSNSKIKEEIIQEYIHDVSRNKVPNLISKNSSGFAMAKSGNVSTLEEATKLVRAMFR